MKLSLPLLLLFSFLKYKDISFGKNKGGNSSKQASKKEGEKR